MSTIQTICHQCNKTFLARVRPKYQQRFCSMQCWGYYKSAASPKVERLCLHCGNVFYQFSSKPGVRFCSNTCKYASMKKKHVPMECHTCKKVFSPKDFREKRSKHPFCSSTCFYVYIKIREPIEKICQQCGTYFTILQSPSLEDKNKQKTFCSPSCHYKSMTKHGKSKEYLREYNKIWRKNNKEKVSASNKAWYRRNITIERIKSINRANLRRMIYNATENVLTAKQWLSILAHYGHRCVYCGKKSKKLTMDHVIPIKYGGKHTWDNVVPACMPCNLSKSANPPPVPLQQLLFCPD